MANAGTALTLEIVPLAKRHHRDGFSCGSEPLDRYLKSQATQDARRNIAVVFAAIAPDDTVVGYYTLSAFSIKPTRLTDALARKLPRYPTVPATLLGRLAVDRSQHRRGVGQFLLMDALARAYRATREIASYAVVVDAKNDVAVAFYEHHDFIRFPDTPKRLFLPMTVISKLDI